MRRHMIVAAALAFMAAASPVLAQDTVRLVSGYPDGSKNTMIAELAAMAFDGPAKARVETAPGDMGGKAADIVVTAKPDGRTLLVTPFLGYSIMERTHKHLHKDLVPVVKLTSGLTTTLFVAESSPIKDWKDFVAASKARKLRGVSAQRLAAFSLPFHPLEKHLGVTFEEIATNGGPPLIDLVASGQADFSITTTQLVMKNAGKLRPILTFGPDRTEVFPNVPTLAEVTGDKRLGFLLSFGVFAPRGTPKAVRQELEKTFLSLNASDAAQRLAKERSIALSVTGAKVARAEIARDERVVARMLGR